MRGEVVRKSIHLLGLTYIPLYIYLHREMLVSGLFVALCLFAFIDLLRFMGIFRYPDYVMRKYEHSDFGGHVYFISGALLATILFSKEIAMLSILFLTLGDAVSGVVKRIASPVYGLISGLIASLVSGSILIRLIGDLPLEVLISGSVIAILLDYKPVRIGKRYFNDNLTIPVISGLVMTAVMHIT